MLSTDKQIRKESPMARGLLDYFPLALAEVARVSYIGNEQHNPGEEMHWARDKSPDHADCLIRHLVERGTMDVDGLRHSSKMVWRALALLQVELEKTMVPLDKSTLYRNKHTGVVYRVDGDRLLARRVDNTWFESCKPVQDFRDNPSKYVEIKDADNE
jgi:hypothetical protein